MKNITFIGLFLHLCIFKFIFALYSSKELEIYSVFLKPYGISFKDDIILKVSPDFGKCADLNKTYQDCKSIAANLTSSTSANEFAKLKLLSGSCPSGSYNCFYKTVKSDSILKGWFKKVQNTVRKLCKKQCWKTMQSVVNSCIQSGQSAVKVIKCCLPWPVTSKRWEHGGFPGHWVPCALPGGNLILWLCLSWRLWQYDTNKLSEKMCFRNIFLLQKSTITSELFFPQAKWWKNCTVL